MTKTKKPLAGAGHSMQQGALNTKTDCICKQLNSSGYTGQDEVHISNSVADQRNRILTRLGQGPLTTLEARQQLDILHPAARVMELRNRGHNIETMWCEDVTQNGKIHRVARYLLKRG